MMSVNRSDRPPKVELDFKALTFRFVRFLIDTEAITPEKLRLSKEELWGHFRSFQEKVHSPMKPNEVVSYLNQNKLLVKKKTDASKNDHIEFKSVVFVTLNSDSVAGIGKLQIPNIRIFINEGEIFRNNSIRKGLAVNGLECLMCKKTFDNDSELSNHVEGDVHRFREIYRTSKRKFSVEVEGLTVNKVTCSLDKCVQNENKICISNVSTSIFKIVKEIPLFDLTEIRTVAPSSRTITPGETFEFKLFACFSCYGTYEYPIVFVIQDILTESTYNLLSVVTYRVLKEDMNDLCSVTPYQPIKEKLVVFNDASVVSGIPLPSSASLGYKIPLPQYPIPSFVRKFLRNGFKPHKSFRDEDELRLWETKKLLLNNAPSPEALNIKCMWTISNYVERFKLLLYLEEYQQSLSMLSYNRDGVALTKGELGYWLLEVPGLHEGRPSILKGDSVYVWRSDRRKKFEGIVHDVYENTVSLAFSNTFNYLKNEKVGVEFQLNRRAIRVAHRALELISKENLTPAMFPMVSNDSPRNHIVTRCYNKQIEENHLQKLAVNNIIRNTAHPAPYIIYGPPGTGKTSTIVEAIAQLALGSKEPLKICACAPSNSAANLLATKIIKHVPESQVYRLFSLSYSARDVPPELRKCSNFSNEKNDLLFPGIDVIKSKTVIILTPLMAGRLHGILDAGFYDYLFIDEAGQAEEPLALIPIIGLLKRESGRILGSLVLTGDPKQLGAIIHSRIAAELGLNISLMERLMATAEPYQRRNNGYNANFITKLTYNYRSHASLLHVPNQLFYDDELESHADRNITDWLCLWDRLPVRDMPLIFHGVKGKDDREENSPSYFNVDEILRVADYLTDLLGIKIRGRAVKQEDIVVLTPYNKQVEKFRAYFKKRKWDKINVSTIERFQGRENYVVILSCVRSRKEFLPSDYQFGLGFLRNPKRFNVAITRAKSLMIIVGNPDVLQCDPHWRMLLSHCLSMKCYKGELPEGEVDTDPNKTLALDLSALTLNDVPDSEKPSFKKDE